MLPYLCIICAYATFKNSLETTVILIKIIMHGCRLAIRATARVAIACIEFYFE